MCVYRVDINYFRFLWVNDLNAVEAEIVFMRFLCVVLVFTVHHYCCEGPCNVATHYQPDDPPFFSQMSLSEASFYLQKWLVQARNCH